GRAVGLVDHGIAIVLELEGGAGVTIRAGVPQRRPGGAIDDQVAVALHGRRGARVAPGPRVPDDLAARAVVDQVAVPLHDELVLAVRRINGLVGGQDPGGGGADGDAGLRAAEAAGRGGDRLDAGGAEDGAEGPPAADERLAGGQGGRWVRAGE